MLFLGSGEMSEGKQPQVVVVGGGPAGLYAAETVSAAGLRVSLYEAKPSVGRKLLVAGRGGLNLTHGEAMEKFVTRYSGQEMPEHWWRDCLAEFSPMMLRQWAAGLGIETFQQRTGRVYPREMKAAPLLRRWVERLRQQKVQLHMRHRWCGIERSAGSGLWKLLFEAPQGRVEVEAEAVIFALGGASWSITGSDGQWVSAMEHCGIPVRPWQAANVGWELEWPELVIQRAEGKPIKNAAARAVGEWVKGELMVTRYGLEGGILYQLGPQLRDMTIPTLEMDLKPDVSVAQLCRKMESVKDHLVAEAIRRWHLSDAGAALLDWQAAASAIEGVEELARLVKGLRVYLSGPRPVEEAISSAGGVSWQGLAEDLSLQQMPGVFVSGEMIDWEAPTGGYLMQGCFASARRAARSALAHCRHYRSMEEPI